MIAGQGLHRGRPARVSFARCEGPSRFRSPAGTAPFDALTVVPSPRSTAVKSGVFEVSTVEHVLAAAAACGAYRGLEIAVEGPEIPLADGGAAAFTAAIAALGIPRSAPRLTVVADGTVTVGASSYAFHRGAGVEVEVEVDFGDPRLAPHARWDGSLEDFASRIAAARTFGFAHEVDELARRGLASHVAPESVVVIGDAILSAGPPFTADEPARHKLLDLVGDLFVHGGPPIGRVRAKKPGHAATHAAMLLAKSLGYLAVGL